MCNPSIQRPTQNARGRGANPQPISLHLFLLPYPSRGTPEWCSNILSSYRSYQPGFPVELVVPMFSQLSPKPIRHTKKETSKTTQYIDSRQDSNWGPLGSMLTTLRGRMILPTYLRSTKANWWGAQGTKGLQSTICQLALGTQKFGLAVLR